MWIRVLGSAAGGGFPQWNCSCANCRAVRNGLLPCRPRTQASIAVSADRHRWFLFNVSPDIRNQIEAAPVLWPHSAIRHTPFQGIILSDAEIDSTLGLLMLREARVLHIYATSWVHTALSTWNPLLRTLGAYCSVVWHSVALQEPFPLLTSDGATSGLLCQAFSTLSIKRPAFAPEGNTSPETAVGYRITDEVSGCALIYLPSVQQLHAEVISQLKGCACLLIDGTCWWNDDLARSGVGSKTAHEMGHLPIDGEHGSLRQLVHLNRTRIIYTHVNNTNPLLIENSSQWQTVEAQGIEVAFDGMELEI